MINYGTYLRFSKLLEDYMEQGFLDCGEVQFLERVLNEIQSKYTRLLEETPPKIEFSDEITSEYIKKNGFNEEYFKIYCPKCNSKIGFRDNFCSNCGCRIDQENMLAYIAAEVSESDKSDLCEFCQLCDDCPHGVTCYGDGPVFPSCYELTEREFYSIIDVESFVKEILGM